MENLTLKDYPKVHDTLNLRVREAALRHTLTQQDNQASNPPNHIPSGFAIDLAYLRDCQSMLKQKPFAKPWEINSSLEALFRQGIAEIVFQKVIDRLGSETGFLHQMEELGMIDPLRRHFTNKKIGDVRVYWGSSWLLAGGGEFRAVERDIRLRDLPPTPVRTLRELAQDGTFPNSIFILEHEMIHSEQYLFGLMDRTRYLVWDTFTLGMIHPYSMELFEMHAYRAEQHQIGLTTSAYLIKHVLEAKTQRGKAFYSKADERKLTYAAEATEVLDVLGLSPSGIGAILRNAGKWDRNRGIYPGVKSAINRLTQDRNLTDIDLSFLNDCHKIERDLDIIKAMHITQEEILAQ